MFLFNYVEDCGAQISWHAKYVEITEVNNAVSMQGNIAMG